ncbi:unnamed protein product [Darwinula stevensoni]|uniref:Amiloride-sensitive sodium channel n=1 Tax=Darwinula stevensoni TaxID=69355 RepID=A0A7R8XAC5_9CRUS|nr:unnamed protein product [Darwinula stevensoni]CAG0886550.1 unnamed protein product [Darwinula stevensoni]
MGVPQEILAYTLGALNRGDSLSQKIRSDQARRDRLEAELNDILEHNQTTIPRLLAAASLRCEQMIISCELGGEPEILEADRCCSEIFKSRPLTSMGPCISTHGYTRYQNYPGASMGLSVMLRVFSSSWLNRSVLSDVAQADGYKVILTANYESPSLAATMRAHSINPGRKTFLGIQAVRNFRSSPLGHPTHQVEHSGMNVYPVRSDACGDVDLTTAPTKSVHDLMDDYPYSWNCVERIFREATINSSCKCYPADTLSSEELQNLNLSVCRPETYMWCMRQEVASDTYADLVYERAAPIEGGKRSTARMCPENSYHRAPATHLATPEDQILAFPTLASPFPKFHQLPHSSQFLVPVGRREDGTEDVAEEVMDAAVGDPLDHRAHPRDPQRVGLTAIRAILVPNPFAKSFADLAERFARILEGAARKSPHPPKEPKAIDIFDKALETFCDWHDMHGLYFLRNRKNLGIVKWLIWVVVECSVISWALYLCYSPFTNLINGKHTVSMDMDGALLKRRLLPDITICPTNPLREDAATALGVPQEILAYSMGALNRGDSLSQKIRIDEVRRDRLQAELNDILEHNQTTIPHLLVAASLRCEDMVISCELGGDSRILEAEQCCAEIFQSRPLTSMGPCISTHGFSRIQNYPGSSMGLSVMLRVFSSSWLNRSVLSDVAQADGYKAILTANYESPSLAAKMRAHSINPSRKTLLGLQAVRVSLAGKENRTEILEALASFACLPNRDQSEFRKEFLEWIRSVARKGNEIGYFTCLRERAAYLAHSTKSHPFHRGEIGPIVVAFALTKISVENLSRISPLGHPTHQVEHSGMNVYPVRSNACGDVDLTMAPTKSVHDLVDHFPYSWNCVERIFREATINSSCKCFPADTLSSQELQNVTLPVCRPETYMWCMRRELASDAYTERIYDRAEKECKPLCTESSYEALVTYDHLNPAYVESVMKQLGRNLTQSGDVAIIGVHYNMLSERVITYTAYAIIDLISSTGGILGLIFGGSCMTVIEFITFNVWLSRRFVMWGNKRMREKEARKIVLASLNAAARSKGTIYLDKRKSRGLTTRDCLFV